jgi:hypothetical protein
LVNIWVANSDLRDSYTSSAISASPDIQWLLIDLATIRSKTTQLESGG